MTTGDLGLKVDRWWWTTNSGLMANHERRKRCARVRSKVLLIHGRSGPLKAMPLDRPCSMPLSTVPTSIVLHRYFVNKTCST